jgi:hypothetical protein
MKLTPVITITGGLMLCVAALIIIAGTTPGRETVFAVWTGFGMFLIIVGFSIEKE